MDTPETVPASEFTRNFGRYRMRAQREAIAVSSHGQITGYFVGPDEYEEFKRYRESRRSFATAELPEEKFQAIGVTARSVQNRTLAVPAQLNNSFGWFAARQLSGDAPAEADAYSLSSRPSTTCVARSVALDSITR